MHEGIHTVATSVTTDGPCLPACSMLQSCLPICLLARLPGSQLPSYAASEMMHACGLLEIDYVPVSVSDKMHAGGCITHSTARARTRMGHADRQWFGLAVKNTKGKIQGMHKIGVV